MVLQIPHVGDQQGALVMLRRAAVEKGRPAQRMDRFHYAFPWTDRMLAKTLGIMGHSNMEKRGEALYPYYAILLLAAVILIRTLRSSDLGGYGWQVVFIVAFYSLVLMQLVNYPAYSGSGLIDVGHQGRYLFPVLAPICALVAWAVVRPFGSGFRGVPVAVVGAVFLYGELPFFLRRVTPDWYF
jgi:hypothetical protein